MTFGVTIGDLLVTLSILGSAAYVVFTIGGRLGRIEGWVQEARLRFDRIETKVDRVIEQRAASS